MTNQKDTYIHCPSSMTNDNGPNMQDGHPLFYQRFQDGSLCIENGYITCYWAVSIAEMYIVTLHYPFPH